MRPRLRPAEYVYVTVSPAAVSDATVSEAVSASTVSDADGIPAAARIDEDEAVTLVLTRTDADARGLDYEYVARWITLDVHSALDAVGLTAAFATALAAAGISCNVLAGYHHDHVLVDTDRASEAVSVLERLAAFARQDDGGSD